MNNQYEQTKKMLNLIRENAVEKDLINEEEATTQSIPAQEEQHIEERIELQGVEKREEEKKFREIVSPRVEFRKIIIYPQAGNVEWSGRLTDSQIEWQFSLDDSRGVYMTTELLQLRDDTLETIKKLVGFYESWADEWANRIADEYRKEDNGEQPTTEPGDDLD